jgi:DNA adenine methylase
MAPYIKKIDTLECRSYDSLIDPKGYLIYCDPPYEGTKKYGAVEKFDSEKFWETVRKWSKDNIVIVSEFTAPSDFKCIWKKKRKILLTNGSIKANPSKTEKLFMHDPVRQKRFSYKK